MLSLFNSKKDFANQQALKEFDIAGTYQMTTQEDEIVFVRTDLSLIQDCEHDEPLYKYPRYLRERGRVVEIDSQGGFKFIDVYLSVDRFSRPICKSNSSFELYTPKLESVIYNYKFEENIVRNYSLMRLTLKQSVPYLAFLCMDKNSAESQEDFKYCASEIKILGVNAKTILGFSIGDTLTDVQP
jgi:hypothetical protein